MLKRFLCFLFIGLLLAAPAYAISLDQLLEKAAPTPNVDEIMGRAPSKTWHETVTSDGTAYTGNISTYNFASENATKDAANTLNDQLQQEGYSAQNISEGSTSALLYTQGETFVLMILDMQNASVHVMLSGGSNGGSDQDPAPTPEQETQGALPQDNYLKIKVNGEEKVFQVTSSYTSSVGPSICLNLATYNPHGNEEATLSMFFLADISADNPLDSDAIRKTHAWEEVTFSYFQGSTVNMWSARTSSVYGFVDTTTSYHMIITNRSDDWKHYEGTFDAVLPPTEMYNSAKYNVELTEGTFSFTLK
ncbi:MAG: hypothetical protein RR521_12635 [Clostridia bacterium]